MNRDTGLLFLDTEFTGLRQNTSLVSVAIVLEYRPQVTNIVRADLEPCRDYFFYGEVSDFGIPDIMASDTGFTHFFDNHVRNKLLNQRYPVGEQTIQEQGDAICIGQFETLAKELRKWLDEHAQAAGWQVPHDQKIGSEFCGFECWCDCAVWDWLLFCELLGGTLNRPASIQTYPYDLQTVQKLNGKIPAQNPEKSSIARRFDALQRKLIQPYVLTADVPIKVLGAHHALWDAIDTQLRYRTIFKTDC